MKIKNGGHYDVAVCGGGFAGISAALAAAREGACGCLVIANPTAADLPLTLQMNAAVKECFLTANGENEKPIALPAVLPRESILVVRTER